MKLIPLDLEGKSLVSINRLIDFEKRIKKHQGNFGLVTGNKNGIIAIEITKPELNVYSIYFQPSLVICTEDVDPEDVIKGKSLGFIIYKCHDVDFEELDFTGYLFGFRILGNNRYTQHHGNFINKKLYVNHGNFESISTIDIDKLLAKKNEYDFTLNTNSIFYNRTENFTNNDWIQFYSRYIKSLNKISDQIYSNGEDTVVSKNGIFRIQHSIGYPHDFMKNIQNKKDEWADVQKYCGTCILCKNDEYMIIERNDGYYIIKLLVNIKELQLTNWTGKIESINKMDSMDFQITTKTLRTGQPVEYSFYVNSQTFASTYMIKKIFAKYGLLFFTKSDNMVYMIFNCLLDKCKIKLNMYQDTFRF